MIGTIPTNSPVRIKCCKGCGKKRISPVIDSKNVEKYGNLQQFVVAFIS